MIDWQHFLIGALAVMFIGVSKAGFGGGLGMLTTSACAIAFGPKEALGTLLPLLCAGDAFSLVHYWRKWDSRNLRYLLPGAIIGVIIGVQLIGRFSPHQLNVTIGLLAIVFVLYQWFRDRLVRTDQPYEPRLLLALPMGVGAGLTSSFAHGAGPLISSFLIVQRLPKQIYIGTTVLIFTWINWIKMPFFIANRIITEDTLRVGAIFLPMIPAGVWLGIWLNHKVSEFWFTRLIYGLTLLMGLHLVLR